MREQNLAQTPILTTSEFVPTECACGETFQTRESYQEHLALYSWHRHIALKGSKFVCKLCAKPFNNLDLFLKHWKREDWHERNAMMMRYVRPRKRQSISVEMRPAERELLRDRIRSDKTKWRLKLGRRAENLIKKEIMYSVKRLAMFTLVIIGIPDVGKSSVALALAELIRKQMLKRLVQLFKSPDKIQPKLKAVIEAQGDFEFYRPKVRFNFSVDVTRSQFARSRLGYVVVQDEDPNLMGKRSGIIKGAIDNLLNQMREAGISLVFCDPEMVEFVKMPNLIIEVVAKSEEHRICKCIVYDRKKVARGWANIRILDDEHPLMVKYRPEKTANVQKKRSTGGLDSAHVDWEEFTKLCKKARDHVDALDSRGDIDPYTCPIRTLEIAILSADLPGDQFIQQGVLDTVKTYYRKTKGRENGTEPAVVEINNLRFQRIKHIKEIGFLDKIAAAWPHVLQKRKERKEKPPDKFVGELHAQAWLLKYKGDMDAKSIGRELAKYHPKKKPVSHGMINNKYEQGGYPAIFKHEVSGECNEFAIWQDYFEDYEWLGGHGLPDLAKDDHWIEVKLRDEARQNLSKYITEWEAEHAREGKPLTLVLVDYDFGKCDILFYNVTWAEDEEAVQEDDEEEEPDSEKLLELIEGTGEKEELLEIENTD